VSRNKTLSCAAVNSHLWSHCMYYCRYLAKRLTCIILRMRFMLGWEFAVIGGMSRLHGYAASVLFRDHFSDVTDQLKQWPIVTGTSHLMLYRHLIKTRISYLDNINAVPIFMLQHFNENEFPRKRQNYRITVKFHNRNRSEF
jgi:hypothetical protein